MEESYAKPKSNFVIPGSYIDDGQTVKIAHGISSSAHSELKITDISLKYFHSNQLHVHRLSHSFIWLNAGTHSWLQNASAYFEPIGHLQGVKIDCPGAHFVLKFITLAEFEGLPDTMLNYKYSDYLQLVH